MFRLASWPDDAPEREAWHEQHLLEEPTVRARFGERPLRHIGEVNTMPLWVAEAEPEGPVFGQWMVDGAYLVDQVADSRAALVGIAELLELPWQAHKEAFTLPHDDAHRNTAREVLEEIARNNPGSEIGFWRYNFFRQYDLHMRV